MMQIFSLFPQLFSFQLFAFTLLRLSAAYAFLYMANSMIRKRRAIAQVRVPVIGRMPEWLTWISSGVTAIIGCMLGIGLYTQVAAILGALLALKHYAGVRMYPDLLPLSRGTYALLFIICLVLLFTGAGAVAFDLPL